MFVKKLIHSLMIVFTLILSLTSCSEEDCEEEHNLCLAHIKTGLDKFAYDETCRYPSMNSGDARLFCECEDEYSECKGL